MRIALLLPTYWPEVTRGSERLVHDLAVTLAGREHEVTVLTTHRHRASAAVEEGVRVERRWRPAEIGPLRWYEHHVATIPGARRALSRGRFDIAHAFFLSDAVAAAQAEERGGPPFVYSIHGIPTRGFLVARRRRLEMIEHVVGRAQWISALSEAAAEPLRRYFATEPLILPGGVDLDAFRPVAERASDPTLVCSANLGDPRKGADVLFRSFERVRRELPAARLRLIAGADPVMGRAGIPPLPDGADWVTVDGSAGLAREYSAAWASVLPATDEAFGLVVIESLACGTPAIVSHSGALPELVRSDQLGWVAEHGSEEGLTAVILAALSAPPPPERAQALRAEAGRFDWEQVAGQYERAYSSALYPER